MIPKLATLITINTLPDGGFTATVGSEACSGDAPLTRFEHANDALFAACEVLRGFAVEEDALVFHRGAWAVVNVLVPRSITRLTWQPFEAAQVA